MILINLLPHRQMARKKRKDAFNIHVALSVGAGLLVAGGIYMLYQALIEAQQGRNNLLRSEIATLEGRIKEITEIEAEIAALKARQQSVEDLQSNRNLPVHLLNELVLQLPDGVFITSLKQSGMSVALEGTAQSNQRISDALRNLAEGSPWFAKPELLEIVADSIDISAKDKRPVAAFKMRFQLQRPTGGAAQNGNASRG